jgi:5-methylcytosine-specific restriction protein A
LFRVNQEYYRDVLLSFVGSNQGQSGIIWGNAKPDCVIVTSGGRHGKNAGYSNIRQNDGTWLYIGQGSSGDQDPTLHSNSLLASVQRDVLLFSTREPNSAEAKSNGHHKKLYKFEGIFNVLSWDLKLENEGARKGDKLLIFHLVPANNIYDNYEVEIPEEKIETIDINKLYNKIKNDNRDRSKKGISFQEYVKRSLDVKIYALLRAKGICELCESPAPFTNSKGKPFLEVHHIFRLADDGFDEPENVAALCPNCHKEAHFGTKNESIKEILVTKIYHSILLSK